MIDFMAKRYSKTPTQILESGSTFDLYVAETALGYESFVAKRERGEIPDNHGHSQEELQAMVDRVKNKNDSKTKG